MTTICIPDRRKIKEGKERKYKKKLETARRAWGELGYYYTLESPEESPNKEHAIITRQTGLSPLLQK